MISIPQAAAALEAPADSLEELYERLGLYIGQTISLESDSSFDSEKVIARLESVTLKTDRGCGDSSWLDIVLSGAGKLIRTASLEHHYRVLSDGLWKTIHTPKATEEVGP